MIWTPLLAFVITAVLYLSALKIFPKLGLVDFPQRYGLARTPLPYPTGIIAVVCGIAFLAWLLPAGSKRDGILLAVAVLALVSFVDDRRPLHPLIRLTIQMLMAALIFAAGSQIYTITSPFGGILKLDTWIITTPLVGPLPVVSGLFTVGWLLLTVNALNWFDGIGGQVSVISFIGFVMLGCLAYFRNGETDIAVVSFSLAAIAGAGTLFDFPPSRMLIGDTGSMFFGLMLGVIAVMHGGKVATAFLALGIPLLDAGFVILRRLLKGQSPLQGGRDHLHHLLLCKGWSERQVVLLTAGLGTAFGVTALFLSTVEKGIAIAVLIVVMVGLTMYASQKKN